MRSHVLLLVITMMLSSNYIECFNVFRLSKLRVQYCSIKERLTHLFDESRPLGGLICQSNRIIIAIICYIKYECGTSGTSSWHGPMFVSRKHEFVSKLVIN